MPIFGELDYRMSVVERWSVARTIRKQNLAEHSFNVAIIADRIAWRWGTHFSVVNTMYALRGPMLAYALNHDRAESVTGDFPSYMKPFVDEAGALNNVPAFDIEEDFSMDTTELSRFFVKCADYIDACIFLRMEISLGNRTVAYHLRNLEARFRKYIEAREKDLSEDCRMVYTWYVQDVVDGLFGSSGQYVSEIDGFPKAT